MSSCSLPVFSPFSTDVHTTPLFSIYFVLAFLAAGFIDFIVEPTFTVLIDTTEKVIGPLIDEDRKAKETGNRRSRYVDYNNHREGNIQWDAMVFTLFYIFSALLLYNLEYKMNLCSF